MTNMGSGGPSIETLLKWAVGVSFLVSVGVVYCFIAVLALFVDLCLVQYDPEGIPFSKGLAKGAWRLVEQIGDQFFK
jgi:hypothetical protein